MLIRCSDSCKFQEDGFCGLKNIYSESIPNVNSHLHEINETGCIYYKPKSTKRQPPEIRQSNQENRKYF